jgi:hypothetical protein
MPRLIGVWFALPILVGLIFWSVVGTPYSSINTGLVVFLLIIPFTTINPLFSGRNLEFLFSRAISRITLFYVRASLYLIICLLPLTILLGCSLAKPVMKVEFVDASHPVKNRFDLRQEALQKFYLTHFEGAFLQPGGRESYGNTAFVVLPKGRVDQAILALIWLSLSALIFQILVLRFFHVKRWIPAFAFFVLMTLTILGDSSHNAIPSFFQTCLGLIDSHRFLLLAVLGVLMVLSQRYCCRRFVNLEITS